MVDRNNKGMFVKGHKNMNNYYNKSTQKIEEKVIDLYIVEELGSVTIGKKLDISKTTVLRILKRNNISMRTISESGRKLYQNGYKHPMQKLGPKKKKHDTCGRSSKGPFMSKDGYIHIWKDNKVKRYHRWIWEELNGKIPEGYVIHHEDGDKMNNNIQNLEMIKNSEHTKLHWERGDIRCAQ